MNVLELQNIRVVFNQGTVNETLVFEDFNLIVEQGQFVSIIGGNGSGKTTLLNLIAGSIVPAKGSLIFEGKHIVNFKEHMRSQFLGRVFQDPGKGTCPSLTILENIALADKKGYSFRLQQGIDRKRIDYYRFKLSQLGLGLEDKIHVSVSALSGGQRQALALLMCTMTPVKLLILDEHTAALDPKISETIMELTDRIVKEKRITALMVTHNLRHAVQYGNRLLMMDKGETVIDASGTDKERLGIEDLVQKFTKISVGLGI